MKSFRVRQSLIALSTVLTTLTFNTNVCAGGEGRGGTGLAYVFKELSYRLHREVVMAPYDPNPNVIQPRDEMDTFKFLVAIENTAAVITDEPLYDKNGDPQTVIFLTPDEVRAKYKADGLDHQKIEELMKDRPWGMYKVNEARFREELKDMPVALATIFHEIRRAMGLDETNYRTSASRYGREFFEGLVADASPVSQEVFRKSSAPDLNLIRDRRALISAEKARVKKEMDEDLPVLMQLNIERRPYVEELRKAASRTFNAYAGLLRAMPGIAMPFPSAYAGAMKAIGRVVNEGMNMQQKLSEVEVINLKAEFLNANYKRNAQFYAQIDTRDHELFCESVGGCPSLPVVQEQ